MPESQPFITYLERLRGNRAALARLRVGLGRPPGAVPEMFRYLAPWLPDESPPWVVEAYFVIASLFAVHPEPGGVGDMGEHFARAIRAEGETAAVERRFVLLLSSHPDDLPVSLRHAVSYLRARDVAINWHQLLSDYLAWGHPAAYVQQRWARAFWGAPAGQESEEEA